MEFLHRQLNNLVCIFFNKCIRLLIRCKPTYLNQCKTICIINSQRCNQSSTYTYCTDHMKILREFCRLYHLYENRQIFLREGMLMADILETEIQLRLRYRAMFQLDTDEGHALWIRYLTAERDLYLNNEPIPSYEIILPRYNNYTINQWIKHSYLDAERVKYSLSQPISNNNCLLYPIDISFTRQNINQHYFDCQCHGPYVTTQLTNALDLQQPTD